MQKPGPGDALLVVDAFRLDSGNLDEDEIARRPAAGTPRRKRSSGQATWPGRKQVLRSLDATGRIAGDVIALSDEKLRGIPLLEPVMRGGRGRVRAEQVDREFP